MFNSYPREKSRRIYESRQGKGLKILTPKQILQKLPIALAQIKAGNNSENFLVKLGKFFNLYINQKKLPKKYIIT